MKERFYMYPGVFQVDGKNHSAFINVMTGEIKFIDKQVICENMTIEIMKILEDGNLGVILPYSHPLFLYRRSPFFLKVASP